MITFREVDPSILGKKYRVKKTEEKSENSDINVVEYHPVTIDIKPVPDQHAKKDAGKPKLSLVPPQIIFDIADVREFGNSKYGDPENWKDVEIERYRDAAFRHLLRYIQDPKGVDEESGLSHLAHLACNVAFLCELERK